MKAALEQLRLQSGDWGIALDCEQLATLGAYANLLAEYEYANVIGTKNPEKIVIEHLIDSLSCLLVEDLRESSSIIDVGAGGGLPGIPLAIARPELNVTLLEATKKKVRFLDHARASLRLQNVVVLQGRAEYEGMKAAFREAFDLAVARALAELPVVVEYCTPLVRVGGKILAMKGRLPEEELSQGVAASRELGIKMREVCEIEYRVELPQKERRLVVLDKLLATPERFPRRVGLAKKRPLGKS